MGEVVFQIGTNDQPVLHVDCKTGLLWSSGSSARKLTNYALPKKYCTPILLFPVIPGKKLKPNCICWCANTLLKA